MQMDGKNCFKVTDSLPFYWRLKDSDAPSFGVPDRLPFEFEVNEDGLLIQSRSEVTLNALEKVYSLDYNIGYIQEGYEIAEGYVSDFKDFLERYLGTLPVNSSIIEIGCGGALLLNEFASRYNVLGIDPSPTAIRAGQKYGIKVIPQFFSPELLDSQVNFIFHSDVLEHAFIPDEFLRQQFEALTPGGIAAISVPDATQSIEVGDISVAMHQHLQYYSLESLRFALEKAGFEVLTVEQAKYGGSLYAAGKKSHRSQLPKSITNENKPNFLKFKSSLERFQIQLEADIESGHTVGFYVPLRTMPYLSALNLDMASGSKFRFFDDTEHWKSKLFDGTDIAIESFQEMVQNPPNIVYIMSLTFSSVIRKKIQLGLDQKVKIRELLDIISD